MKLTLRILVLFFLAVWLEQSVLPFVLPGQASFRLVTLMVINLGVLRGPIIASCTGFLLGILVSLLTGEPLGVGSLALTCIGYSAGWAAERLRLVLPGMTFVLTVGLLAMEWALTSLMAWLMFEVIYQFSWVNFLSAVLISPLVFWLCRPFFSRTGKGLLYA